MTSILTPNAAAAPSVSSAQLLERFRPESPFFFSSPTRTILAQEAREVVSHAAWASRGERLEDRVAALLAGAEASGNARPLVVGALPFDNASPAHLVVSRALLSEGPLGHAAVASQPPSPVSNGRPRMVPEPRDYVRGVEKALELMRTEALSKVVLSRMVEVPLSKPLDIQQLLRRLTQQNPSGYTFAVNLSALRAGAPGSERDASAPAQRTLIGSSPELLVSRLGTRVVANPLAGSAPRCADPAEDQRRAGALLASEKDRREHAIVIDAVADALRPLCRRLHVPAEPSLTHTQTMWHLSSQLTGELADLSISSLKLAMALHPTPAVCGYPAARARAAIKSIEPFDRGFFTGAVGYCDAGGDGEWAVAIRCADVTDGAVRLYSGAGIVAGSDAERELSEVSAKLRTMLNALGLDRMAEVM